MVWCDRPCSACSSPAAASVSLIKRDVAGDDGVGFIEDVPITLHVGTKVDLLLHFIGDDMVDTTDQELDIVSR